MEPVRSAAPWQQKWLGQGHEVFLLSRNPDAHKAILPQGVHLTQWDGRSAKGWGELVNGDSAIVNLAGENISSGRWSQARKKRILESRTNAGRAVSEAVEKAQQKPRVVIQASAIGYYEKQLDTPLQETHAPGDDFQSRVLVAYEESTKAVEKFGVRRAVIRTGVVLDRRSGALPKMVLPFYFFVGGPIGSGNQWFSWIHIEDVVAGLQFLIENPEAHGPYNLTAPAPLTNRQFSRAIGKALHRPSWFPVPAFVLRIIFGEMATVVLDGQRVIPSRLLELGFKFRYAEAVAGFNQPV